MQFININNNVPYKASTRTELAYELYTTSWLDKTDCMDLHDWMRLCAGRILEGYEIEVAFGNPVAFVDDLIFYNFIKEIN